MKKIFLLTVFFSLAFRVFGQSNDSNTIIVDGNASLKTQPDLARIDFQIETLDSVQAKSLKKLNLETQKVIEILTSNGFNAKSIKVAEYTTESSTDSENPNKKTYTASNSLSVEFYLDKNVINELIKKIEATKLSNTTFSLTFRVS